MTQSSYNPDVLSCLANLSNDEVFTPPTVVNRMLDLLPTELWSNPDATFLDPVSKTGVFLREIAKRLIVGLADKIPDQQERIDHIFSRQLFGLAITELTALVSRRSVYCTKTANSRYCVCSCFDDEQGNIRYRRTEHVWRNGKCRYCGASEAVFGNRDDLETHAYQFIHTDKPQEIFNMKFDVIIGNPPYQLSDGGGMQSENSTGSAIPIYQHFVTQAKKLSPRYLIMIIPARWYSGGRGLDDFRDEMLHDDRMSHLIDYPDSRDCFPNVDIAGGICYFLWDRSHSGKCETTNITGISSTTTYRRLDEFPYFIRHSLAINIIHKVLMHKEPLMSSAVYSSKPFGFRSFEEGKHNPFEDCITLFGSKGLSYVKKEEVTTNESLIPTWKVIMSKSSAEHAGQTDKDGRKKIVSRVEVLPPDTICSESYLLLKTFDNQFEATNMLQYVKTSFFRFLLSTVLLTQNIAKDKFCFVPLQDFSEPWTDEKLYAKYNLSTEEIAFIESMIRPME